MSGRAGPRGGGGRGEERGDGGGEGHAPAERLVSVTLRTLHLFTMAVVVGGIWLGAAPDAVKPWMTAAVGSGLLLLVTELRHEPARWPRQGRGLAVILHVAALGLLGTSGRVATALALVLGAAGSHAPKRARKWTLGGE